ncbi:MAG TPA: hypothetical protein VHV30_08735 [Polyangiaceae bacterium]|jgi:hypothetical protein|nr:hypothetical protein [Polyangiaceae bacterium]
MRTSPPASSILAAPIAALAFAALVHCGSSSSGSPASSASGDGGHGSMNGTDATTAAGDDAGGPGDGGGATPNDGGTSPNDGSSTTQDGAAGSVTTIGTFLGVNALITDAVANLAPIGVVREYHNWGWLGNNYDDQPYPHTLYTPNIPSFQWDWDGFFSDLRSAGVSGFPAVQGTVPWVADGGAPPASGSPTAAASYVSHGDMMFQVAARWGSTKVDDAKLELASGQTRSSGLGTVEYFEDYNEEDNVSAFTGDVWAAMASADYDGDQGRLGPTIGIKSADPNAKLVMGGLSGAYGSGNTWSASITKFLDAARAWSATNRGGSFPADVINVHYYSFGPGGSAPALSPEDDGVQGKLATVVAYRDMFFPGKPVWWTEFGYDTYVQSRLHAPAIGANSAFIVQAQWLVRDLLAALAAGIDRATLFELDDTCTPPSTDCNTQFATCGLLATPGSTPKASWYFLATFRARMKTMTYTGAPASGAADVKIASFDDTAGPGGALVVWAPTSKGTVHKAYSLALPSSATTAKSVVLEDMQPTGVENGLTSTGGSVTLDVSETPTLVLYSP